MLYNFAFSRSCTLYKCYRFKGIQKNECYYLLANNCKGNNSILRSYFLIY